MHQDSSKSPFDYKVLFPLLFALVLVIGMLVGMRLNKAAPTVIVEKSNILTDQMLGQGRVEELIRYIDAKYVDEVDRKKLIEKAINSILEGLDPHSNYISADQLQEVNENLEGNFDGIGVEFMVLEDTIMIVSTLAGGPSEAVGVLAGDKIVMIGDSLVAGESVDTHNVIKMLRGEKGSKVIVGILRGREKQVRHFTITRDKIPVHSVDIAYMLDEKTGYIKLNRFSATTYEEFMKGLEKMVEEEGMQDLVIDLRHNPGGYLQQATNILSQLFKEKGKLLVYTEGRTVNRNDYESSGRSFFNIGNIAVLIDEGSASASEILAGAIQDHDRGVIIGRRSFGKGLVQEQYKLRDGSALRLTVARYYTPSGRSIQKPYNDLDTYDNDFVDRLTSGELSSGEKVHVLDSTEYFTSGGHVVYGGGGIIPDVFVPIDTVLFQDEYMLLRQHIPQFVYRYLEDHQSDFEEYTLDRFRRQFTVSEAMLKDFISFTGEKVFLYQLGNTRQELKRYIKARIAKHLFEDKGFYSIWHEDDPAVLKALEVLREPNPMAKVRE
ncbi:MAG: peptidase S41 [Saprospiraceae bacterium]|nr:MAG: peptidase S41 [Saprospiraceae bacterium]